MNLNPVQLCQAVARAYDPAFLAAPAAADLSDLGLRLQSPVYFTDLDGPKCYGFLACPADGSGGQLLALRGTDDVPEGLEDAQILLTPYSGPGRVHSGFWRLCRTIAAGPASEPFLPKIVSLAALSVAGHSLGAALARQLSLLWGHLGSLTTWGEPRSCDGAAAGYALACVGYSSRRLNSHDPVPMVPIVDPLRPFDGYRHVDEPLLLGSWGDTLVPSTSHAIALYLAHEQALAATSSTAAPIPA